MRRLGRGSFITSSNVGPIGDLPDGTDIVRADIFVVQVVRMLPDLHGYIQ